MNLIPLELSSGKLTMITFAVIAAFIILGSMSLRRHVRRAAAPWESDLSPEGRAAERFEHQND